MFSTWILLALTGLAAITDLRFGKIYNWLTYPGIIAGWLISAVEPGGIGWESSVQGTLGCGLIMLICFVLFNVSGGDVKLVTMQASFLGWQGGIAALLWTCILGAVMAIALLIWRMGCVRLMRSAGGQLFSLLRWVLPQPLTEHEQKQLQAPLMLGPAAFLAVVFVRVLNWQ